MVVLDHLPEDASPVSVSQAGLIRLNAPARGESSGIVPLDADVDERFLDARCQLLQSRQKRAQATAQIENDQRFLRSPFLLRPAA